MTNVVKFTNGNKQTFYCLQSGQAFIYDEALYIKMMQQTSSVSYDANAVNVVNGRQIWIGGDMTVEPVDLEIIVK